MVNFADLKAKAEKAKDAGVTKVTNARDRMTSAPSSQANYNPHWKRQPPPPPAGSASPSSSRGGPPPPPPLRSRPEIVVSDVGGAPPVVPRASRPTDSETLSPSPSYTPRPPPTRVASVYPPSHSQDAANKIDWANLSLEDKEAFFGWLDEFFSRYLGIELGPRERRRSVVSCLSAAPLVHDLTRPPPTVNMATRPPV